MKKEIKHDCPTDMIYSDRKGKCINPELEDEKVEQETVDDPNSRDKVPTQSLRFQHTKGKVQGVPNEKR